MGGDDSQKLLPWRGSYSPPGRKPPAQLRNQHSNSKAICSGAVVPAPCFRGWKVVGQFPGRGPSALSSSELACDAHPATE